MTELPSTPLAHTLHLVQGAQRGDSQATDELLTRYLPRVRRIVALRLGKQLRDITSAEEDLVQETLLRAWQHLDRFDAESSEASFRGWIATIAVNRIRDVLRREQRQARDGRDAQDSPGGDADEFEFTSSGPTPSQHAIQREEGDALELVIRSLPGPYRQIVDLRDYVGLSYAEAAEQMGRTVMSCRKLHQRAWEMIRERQAGRS